MNLHTLKRSKHPRNEILTGLDWTEGGFAIVVDTEFPCIGTGRRNMGCYAGTGVRGHSQDCLHDLPGAMPALTGLRTEGTYLCECPCHEEDEVGMFGTYTTLAQQPIGARYINSTMWGELEPRRGNRYLRDGHDSEAPYYWCRPCRQNEHHWTE